MESRELTYADDWKDIHRFLAAKPYGSDAWNPAYAAFLIKAHTEALAQARATATETRRLVLATWAVAAATIIVLLLR